LRVTHGPLFGDTTDHECPIDGGVLLCSTGVVRAMMFSEDGPRMWISRLAGAERQAKTFDDSYLTVYFRPYKKAALW